MQNINFNPVNQPTINQDDRRRERNNNPDLFRTHLDLSRILNPNLQAPVHQEPQHNQN